MERTQPQLVHNVNVCMTNLQKSRLLVLLLASMEQVCQRIQVCATPALWTSSFVYTASEFYWLHLIVDARANLKIARAQFARCKIAHAN